MRPASGNLGDLLHEAVTFTPHKLAVIGKHEQLTYKELDERIKRAGNVFKSLGIVKGDRVALLFPNDVSFIEICFGLMRIGAVPVPLNIKLSIEVLSYILTDSGAKLVVYKESLLDKAQRLQTGDGPCFIQAGGHHQENTYEDLREKASTELETVHVEDDDLCFLPYTSGSTGKPKGCMLTHHGQWWNAYTTAKCYLLDREDRALVAVPLYHKNAMINAVKPCLMVGASIVIRPDFDPEDVIASIDQYKCTYTTGVPAMFKMILAAYQSLTHYDVSSLQFIVCGSSEVPIELLEALKRTFDIKIMEAYGLTEGGPQVFATPRWGTHKQGSSGLPIPGCEVQIVDLDKNQELPANEIGELWVKNPGVVKGYWNRPELTDVKFKGGWLKTGDLAYLDEDGYGYIIGRTDDMINIGGENAYPKEIEQVLLKHDAVEDVCVIRTKHSVKGEAPVAFIKKVQGYEATTEEEIKRFFIENGPAYAHPRLVFFINEMPLGGTGKIDKGQLKNLLNEHNTRRIP
ncbi:class I adenylate-forming enzyme family protein [Bacillus niameyensis]|uniref:class I adenylate-forming enzyme family protein n=1 Tax=Bacillus niameyensis TaxID=1522308 RepID=UPI00078412F1|nr:class I adenylate-forming enzyme family protein [Bacillus niameyensis]